MLEFFILIIQTIFLAFSFYGMAVAMLLHTDYDLVKRDEIKKPRLHVSKRGSSPRKL